MTVGQLKDFLSANTIPDDTQLFIETGLDVFVAVQHMVYNGEDLNIYQEHWQEEAEI